MRYSRSPSGFCASPYSLLEKQSLQCLSWPGRVRGTNSLQLVRFVRSLDHRKTTAVVMESCIKQTGICTIKVVGEREMSKRKKSGHRLRGIAVRRRRQVAVATAIALSLVGAWTMLASSGALESAFSQKATNGGTVSLASFNSNSPSKEYVYAGGRLIATEEPPPTGPVHHASTIGVYRPNSNFFYLRNANTAGVPDISDQFGAPGDLPIVGDWDGNGSVTIGLYRPTTSTFFLRNSNTVGFPDITVQFGDGPNGDLPISGDWDGNGTWTIGVYRPITSTFYLRNSNTAGLPDITVAFGAAGDQPVIGDWDGTGTMTIGLFRPSGNVFYLRNSNSTGVPDVTVAFGAAGDLPIVGDWDADGLWTIGVYRPSLSTIYLRNTNTAGFPDLSIPYGDGPGGDKPVAGDWDGL